MSHDLNVVRLLCDRVIVMRAGNIVEEETTERVTRDPLDDYIAAAAQALGLTIEEAWMPTVRGNLELILRLGVPVTEFALPDDAEPAPVFEA